MSGCPACSRSVPESAAFCPACGAALVAAAPAGLTRTAVHTDLPAPNLLTPPPVAGTIVASRYRIVGLLGRGGMGEVYRADDVKLGQPVALKFMPDTLAASAAALVRFHAEVRIARRVSHSSVCRVYDVGEVDGLH